jgi:receptor protein-tyrosine kinase
MNDVRTSAPTSAYTPLNSQADILPGEVSLTGANRAMGDILVAAGRMTPEDLERVLESQRREKIPFGDAALALRVVTRHDIDFALGKQFNYAYLIEGDSSLSPKLVAAYKPFSRVGENLRAVRSQLMLRWFNGDPLHKVLAVTSPGSGDGRSFVASNLAIVFSQQGERTLLIDADLRAKSESGLHSLFKLDRGVGLSNILADRAGLEVAQAVPGLPGLAVLPAGAVPPNPQELLGRSTFIDLLVRATSRFDVILIDTPAGEDYADAEIIASRVRAALMVARVNRTLVAQTAALARRMQDSGVTVVGSVLNDA